MAEHSTEDESGGRGGQNGGPRPGHPSQTRPREPPKESKEVMRTIWAEPKNRGETPAARGRFCGCQPSSKAIWPNVGSQNVCNDLQNQ